jgi:hypothetical protein
MIFNQPEPKSVILGILGFPEETMPRFVPLPKVYTYLYKFLIINGLASSV